MNRSAAMALIGSVCAIAGCQQSEVVHCGPRIVDRRASLTAECRPVDEDSTVTMSMPSFKPTSDIFDNIIVTGSGEDRLGRVVILMPWGPQNLHKLPEGKDYWYRSILIARNGRVLSAVRSTRSPRAGECAFRITHNTGDTITISAHDADDRWHGYMMPTRRKSGTLLECVCDRSSP